MTEALFRIPSRTVTYGYVEVSVDLGHSDPEIIAATYVSWVHAFQKEELATIERLKDAPSGALKAPLAASQEAAPGDPQAAADRLSGGRTPRTVDEANEMARQVIEKELGPVTEVPEDMSFEEGMRLAAEAGERHADKIPWKQEVATPKKPWEAEATVSIAAVRAVVLAENLDTPDW